MGWTRPGGCPSRRAQIACILAVAGCLSSQTAADPQTDEANRQRLMASMQAETARTDQANFERSMADQRARSAAANASRPAGSSTSMPSSSSVNPYSGGEEIERGPQSAVARYTIVLRSQETQEQMMARLVQEAASGDVAAQFNLGRIFYTGFNEAPRDDARARDYFRQAAMSGHAQSQANYGYFLVEGLGGAADLAEGQRWLREAASAGNSFGQAQYGMTLVTTNPVEAVRHLIPAADSGEVQAQAMLGTLFAMGEGVAPDDARAAQYLKAASDQGDASSTGLLAGLYISGRGGTPAEGYRLMRQAAEAGDRESLHNYGLLLLQGTGYPKNEADGFQRIEAAARAGNVASEKLLGDLYLQGIGVDQNDGEALRWFATAASHGDEESLQIMRGLSPDELALLPQDAPQWDRVGSTAKARRK